MSFESTLVAGETVSRYYKAIVAIAFAVMSVFVTASTDNDFSTEEIGQIITALLTAVLVYLVPNLPKGPGGYLKFVVAIIGAIVTAGIGLLDDGLSVNDYGIVFLAVLNAIGVGIVPNEGDPIDAPLQADGSYNVTTLGDPDDPNRQGHHPAL